jgi:hypothetical protein
MTWRELRQAVEERERAHYTEIIRRFPWPVAAIRAASPVGSATVEGARLLSRRCHRVTYDWVERDIGWRPTPDEQGALLRHRSEYESLAYVVQHAHGGLTGWYFRPEISPPVRAWLCPEELGTQSATVWEPEAGDEVIWMIRS